MDDPQSGRLFTLVPGGEPQVLATGLKNAYGHTVDPTNGQIYTTDVGDDPVDGKAPPDEINAVVAGGDYGWPRCYAERIPAADRGATVESCASTQPSLVINGLKQPIDLLPDPNGGLLVLDFTAGVVYRVKADI